MANKKAPADWHSTKGLRGHKPRERRYCITRSAGAQEVVTTK